MSPRKQAPLSVLQTAIYVSFLFPRLPWDIDDPSYALAGRSKGKRLRSFLEMTDNAVAVPFLESRCCRAGTRFVHSSDPEDVRAQLQATTAEGDMLESLKGSESEWMNY